MLYESLMDPNPTPSDQGAGAYMLGVPALPGLSFPWLHYPHEFNLQMAIDGQAG